MMLVAHFMLAVIVAAPVLSELTASITPPEFYCNSDRGTTSNLVYRGQTPPSMEKLAECAAPILWMSPDEAFAQGGPEAYLERWRKVPKDCDPVVSQRRGDLPGVPTVYWHSSRGELGLHAATIELRFSFFYPYESGHCGDLEAVELGLKMESVDHVWEVRLTGVKGSAHGNMMLDNRLDIGWTGQSARGLRLPITILVEEDKHASVPDRNGDGFYTPGYDVNRGVNDAWGLRDNFSTGLFASGYDASMSKATRALHPRSRIFPRTPRGPGEKRAWEHVGDLWPKLECDQPDAARAARYEACANTYVLVPESTISGPLGAHDPRKRHSSLSILTQLPMILAYRTDANDGDSAVVTLPLLTDKWVPMLRWTVGLRLGYGRRFRPKSFDVLITPSLGGRHKDWYIAAGTRINAEEKAGPLEFEGGLRFRLKPTGNKFSDLLPLVGMRVGVRADRHLQGARLVFEIGGGWM